MSPPRNQREEHYSVDAGYTRMPFNLNSKKLSEAVESPMGKIVSWCFSKVGWLIVLWFIWSAKTYTIEYIDKTPAVQEAKKDIIATNARVDELAKLNTKQNNILDGLVARQDKADKAFEETLKIQQNLSISVAVQTSRIDTLDRNERARQRSAGGSN